jgi:hypothetical protein
MLGYPKLRRASIPEDERDVFERVGEAGMQLALMGGFNPYSSELKKLFEDPVYAQHAQEWLTERADVQARHEWRMERLEWAILVFVIAGVIADFMPFLRSCGSK